MPPNVSFISKTASSSKFEIINHKSQIINPLNILSEIWSSLSHNRFRTAMTGFAVAWGIFMLIVLLGASSGLEHAMRHMVESSIHNKVTLWPGETSIPYNGLPEDRRVTFEERDFFLLSRLSFVDNFTPIVQTGMNVNVGNHYTAANVTAIEPVYKDIFGIELVKGRFLNPIDGDQKRKVCVVDEKLVEELGGADLLNTFIQIGDMNFLVVGVTGVDEGMFSRSATIYMPYKTYKPLFAPKDLFAHVAFSVDDSYYEHHTPEDLAQTIRNILGPSMKFDVNDERAIYVANDVDSSEEISMVIGAIQLFILIVGWLMLVSGVVGVSNIMLVSVRERTKEFGIRKAIGAPPRTILLMVLGESLIITLLFGFIGMYMGTLVIALIDAFVPPQKMFQHPTVDVNMMIIAFVTLVVAGSLAGLTPAIRSMRIKPIEALNYEK